MSDKELEQSEETETQKGKQSDATQSEPVDELKLVSDLLGGSEEEKTKEEETSEEETQQETQEKEEETGAAIPMVDDEIISQFPTLISHKGKPLTEIAKAYDNMIRLHSKVVNELNQLKKEKPKETQETEKEGELKFPEVPDFVTAEAQEINQWALKLIKLGRQIEAQENKTEEKKPAEGAKPGEESTLQPWVDDVRKKLTEKLPKGIEPQNAIAFFNESKENFYFNRIDGKLIMKESIAQYYFDNPDALVNDIMEVVNAELNKNELKSKEKNSEKEVKINSAKKAQEIIRKANQSLTGSAKLPPQRGEGKLTETDKLLLEVQEIALQDQE